ncbi:MAG: class I SAM-dependent methyltransferase [Phycisphaerae bacterium]|nr:class I SAM-dependent methyltransferase [Phycisphaerae bacterium]
MSEPLHLDVNAGYDRWAEIYDDELNPLIVLEEPVVRGWTGDPRGLRVADVGCGTGRHSVWLADAGAQVDAYDSSDGMMTRARAKVGDGVRFIEHTLPDSLPAADGTYDLVLLALVADHLADLDATMRDLYRVLRPGGTLILTVLHPAMNLLGLTARFADPRTGEEIRVAAFEHTYADYVMSALRAGFTIEEITERRADAALAAKAPRAEKYLGWPMLLALRVAKPM